MNAERIGQYKNSFLEQILNLEELEPLKRFHTGHSGAIVLHAKKDNKEYVVKITRDKRSEMEINNNFLGFEKMREEGLEELLPEVYQLKKHNGRKYLLMTYLGEDFESMTRISEKPSNLFKDLRDRMHILYKNTKKRDDESKKFLERIKNRLRKNYEKYLVPNGLLEKKAAELLDFPVEEFVSDCSCFAVFDFTPEDIYLKGKLIKFPDSKGNIRGVPIIDLACFSGVCRDIYALPGSKKGYEILKEFALNEVAELLDISDKNAGILFNYGRALQFSLSSRFRIKTEYEKAQKYAKESLKHLLKAIWSWRQPN